MPQATFERIGCQPVAVDFHDSPSGRVNQKNWGHWEKVADGMIFHTPFHQFETVIGIPGIFGDDFAEEYKRRYAITHNQAFPDNSVETDQRYYNTLRSVPSTDYSDRQLEQLQKRLAE